MDIVTFVNERLNDDERTARAVRHDDWNDFDGWAELADSVKAQAWQHAPREALADVAAKRKMLEFCVNDPIFLEGGYAYTDRMLHLLAEAYSEHADFDPAWRAAN